jgi:urease accessory protein
LSVAAANLPAHAGWRARLRLRLQAAGGRTVLAERQHEGPLVVQRPFYPEGPVCHLYLVHPPGGVAGGDHVSLQVDAGPASQGVITTPAATKIYRSFGTRVSRVEQELAAHDATLEWLPQETIVFRGAHTRLATRVALTGRARFIGWEILCLGRPAIAEIFDAGSIAQDFELSHDGRPLLLDRLRLRGGDAAFLAPWGLGGKSVLGTLLVFPADAAQLALARQDSSRSGIAATLVDGVLLIRLRGEQGETVRREFELLWRALRPGLAGLAAQAPRIWAT